MTRPATSSGRVSATSRAIGAAHRVPDEDARPGDALEGRGQRVAMLVRVGGLAVGTPGQAQGDGSGEPRAWSRQTR